MSVQQPPALKVDTDGSSLIIRHAFIQKGKFYDLRVERRGAEGQIIDAKGLVFQHVIDRVKAEAKELFSNCNFPEKARFVYSTPPQQCILQDTSTGGYESLDSSDPMTQSAARIHGLFFGVTAGYQRSGHSGEMVIQPTLIQPELPAAFPGFTPSHPNAPIVPPPSPPRVFPESTTPPAPTAPPQVAPPEVTPLEVTPLEEDSDAFTKDVLLPALNNVVPQEGLFQGVTYFNLRDYAKRGEGSPEVATAYTHFLRALVSPNQSGIDKMREWLQNLYRAAYEVYQKISNEEERKDAAAAVVALIPTSGYSLDALKNYLKSTSL